MYYLLTGAEISLLKLQFACQIRIPSQWAIGLLLLLFSSFQPNIFAQVSESFLLDFQELPISCQSYQDASLPNEVQLRLQAEDKNLIFHRMEISMVPHPNASPILESIVLDPHLKLQRVSWNDGSLILAINATETITIGEFGLAMEWEVQDWEMDYEVILDKDGIVEVELIQGLKVKNLPQNPVPTLSLQVFPNPASDWISLEFSDHEATDLEIRNPQGQMVAVHKNLNGDHPVSVQGLAAGVYFLVFLRNGNIHERKRLWIK